MPPTDMKLKPLYREITFWVMLAMSLPGIIAIYVAAWNGIDTGSFDPSAFQSAFLASPIIAYLLARQYPRGKAVEAAAIMGPIPPVFDANQIARPETMVPEPPFPGAVQRGSGPNNAMRLESLDAAAETAAASAAQPDAQGGVE